MAVNEFWNPSEQWETEVNEIVRIVNSFGEAADLMHFALGATARTTNGQQWVLPEDDYGGGTVLGWTHQLDIDDTLPFPLTERQ